jgi:hypothetical protein
MWGGIVRESWDEGVLEVGIYLVKYARFLQVVEYFYEEVTPNARG